MTFGSVRLIYFPTSLVPSRCASISPRRAPLSQSNRRYRRSPAVFTWACPCFHLFAASPGSWGPLRRSTGWTNFLRWRRIERGRWGCSCLCIFIVRGSRELGIGGELQHLLVVGIGDIHNVKWVSSAAAPVHRAAPV